MDASRGTIYIETSIPSFCFTARTDPESVARMHWTRDWWDQYASKSTLLNFLSGSDDDE